MQRKTVVTGIHTHTKINISIATFLQYANSGGINKFNSSFQEGPFINLPYFAFLNVTFSGYGG